MGGFLLVEIEQERTSVLGLKVFNSDWKLNTDKRKRLLID